MSTHSLVHQVLPLANWLELSDLPLLTLIFEHVDDSMLAEIAICHYGDDVSTAALKFLGWRMQCQIQRAIVDEDFGYCPCYAVAMLLLCVSLHQCNPEIVSFLISMAYCNHEYVPILRRSMIANAPRNGGIRFIEYCSIQRHQIPLDWAKPTLRERIQRFSVWEWN